MNRERTRTGKAGNLHTLLPVASEQTRPSGRVLLLMTFSVTLGIIVAFVWVLQMQRGDLETLPDVAARLTPTTAASVTVATNIAALPPSAEALTATNGAALPAAGMPPGLAAPAADIAVAELASVQQQGNLPPVVPPAIATGRPERRATALAATVPPPSPTPTPTPLPIIDHIEAVVSTRNAPLFDDRGLRVAQVDQGALLLLSTRNSDSTWLYGSTENGLAGWIAADDLIVVDVARLQVDDVLIIPITPTPGNGSAVGTADNVADSAADNDLLLPTPTGGAPAATPRPAPAGDGPTAIVTLDEGRLNIRTGPGANYPIIAKGLSGDNFSLLGRDATGAWLQLAVSDVNGGFGWAAAEFLTTDAVITDLPVVSNVSDAPTYQQNEPQSPATTPNTQGNTQGKATPATLLAAAPQSAPQPAPQLVSAQPVSGLSGKLVIQRQWGGDIYLYEFATGALRLLTGGFDPSLSPDGRQVAFTRAGGEHGLYLINVDGSNERLIWSGRELLRSPKWSPDGQYIVFERGDEVIRCNQEDSRCVPVNDGSIRASELERERQQKLARVDFNGNNYQDLPVLERARSPDWNSAGVVYWSPAGIQVTQDAPGATTQLVFFNIQKQYEIDPDWQPGGGRIVFQRREHDHWEILAVNPDGTGLQPLTRPGFLLAEQFASNVAPAWSPDGNSIVFLSNRTEDQMNPGPWAIWVMNGDGSNQRRLPIELDFVYTYVAEQMLDWGR